MWAFGLDYLGECISRLAYVGAVMRFEINEISL
jgi:hypothetical protein